MREKITYLTFLLALCFFGVQAQKTETIPLLEVDGKSGNLACNPDSVVINGTVTALCPGQSTTLSTNNLGTYLWSTGATGPFTVVNAPGLIWLLVTDANNCVSDTAFYNIAAGMPTNSNFTWIDNGGTVNFTDASTGGPTTWAWDFGDGDSAFVANPTHTYQQTGIYLVCLTAGGGPCGGTTWCDSVNITFVNTLPELEGKLVAYPNPVNLDLAVDFDLAGEDFLKFQVIDPTGQIVYRTTNTSGDGKISIPVQSLKNGLYSLQVEGAEKIWTRRIVVQH